MINAHLSNPRQKKDPLRSFAISIWFLQKWGLTLSRYPFKNCRIDLLPSQHGWEKISNHKWGYVSCQTHSIHMYGIFTYIYHTNQPFQVGKSSKPTVFRKKTVYLIHARYWFMFCFTSACGLCLAEVDGVDYRKNFSTSAGQAERNRKGIYFCRERCRNYMEGKTITCMYITYTVCL